MDPRYHLLALNRVKGIGLGIKRNLVERFGSSREVFKAAPEGLTRMQGVGPAMAEAIASCSSEKAVMEEIERIDRLGIKLVAWEDPVYPELLRHIQNPPLLLYVRGEIGPGDARSVAVVGARRASSYGRRTSRRMGRELARLGVCVVSGMARGIDTEAHKGALEAGRSTIAVLGCGVDVVYPPENKGLYQAIMQNGSIVSEFPLGTQPLPGNFPVRNRLISGLSRAVVIVEATVRSGSLITAGFALDQGREVFAVPGHIDSARSAGPHRLIRDGALLVRSASDIIDELGIEPLERPVSNDSEESRGEGTRGAPGPISGEVCAIVEALGCEPAHIDDIVRKAERPPSDVLRILMTLELEGVVEQRPGKWFVRA